MLVLYNLFVKEKSANFAKPYFLRSVSFTASFSYKDVTDYEKDGDVILVIYVPAADRENKPVYLNQDLFGGTFKRNSRSSHKIVKPQ